jgi:acyl-CoA synthetase (AMP-forming)/AMP-acid ligase II
MLLRDIINRNARMYPDRTATVWGDMRHTFLEFKYRVNQVANALMDMDVMQGDRVAVLLRNCSPYIELHFGIPQGGMIIVPLNYRNRERELIYAINNSGANTLIVGSDYIDIIDSIRNDIRGVKNFINMGDQVEGYQEYEALISQYPVSDPDVALSEDDVIVIGYTSGTTGRAKGAMITHKSLLTEVRNSHATIPLSPHDIGLNLFPYFHIGFSRCTAYMAMGAKNICADFDPGLACELIENERVTQMAVSPAQASLLVNYPDVGKYDLSSLRKVICGGGHTSLTLLKGFFEIVSEDFEMFWVTLGMTEASPCFLGNIIRREMLEDIERKMNSFKDRKPSGVSVGWAYPYCEVRVVDENDDDVLPWEVGEIVCRGDNLMKGYWRMPEATRETLRNGWLHSGDMGMFTDDGEVYVVDRKKDMILSGDENIYPAEIEEVLHSHPSILEAAVIGVPDQKWGETVKAVVVLKEGAGADEKEIIEYCKQRLSSYKKPTSVDFINELPRNPSGKVLKHELKKSVTVQPLRH